MELKNKFFTVEPHVSEEHLGTCLNHLAKENYVLYGIYPETPAGEHAWFSVVAYKDTKQIAEEKWQAAEKWQATVGTTNNADLVEKLAQKEAEDAWNAAEKWSLTMGTTGGHANE